MTKEKFLGFRKNWSRNLSEIIQRSLDLDIVLQAREIGKPYIGGTIISNEVDNDASEEDTFIYQKKV